MELKHLVDLHDTVGEFATSYTGFDGNLCEYDISTNYPTLVSITTTTSNESHTLTISSSTYSLSGCYYNDNGREICPSGSDLDLTLVVTVTLRETLYYEYEIPLIILQDSNDPLKCDSCSMDPSSLSSSVPITSAYNPVEVSGMDNTEQTFVIPARGYRLTKIAGWSDTTTRIMSGLEFTFSPLASLTGWEEQIIRTGDDTGPDYIEYEIPDD